MHANGIRINYYRRPGAPVLVLVHGLATSLAFWFLKVLPLLPRHMGLLLFDLRGHGRSDMPPSGYTTGDMAADLQTLLEQLSIAEAHLIGHSYGGAVALHHAVLHPERVRSLTLADARVRCLQAAQRIDDWPQAALWRETARELGVANMDDPEMGYRVLEALATSNGKPGAPRRIAGPFTPFGRARGRNVAAKQWLRLLRMTSARRDFAMEAGLTWDRLREVRCPTLAVFGEHSHCLPSLRGLQTHLPNCTAVVVPGAGHFHPAVRPVFFVRTVQRFVESVG